MKFRQLRVPALASLICTAVCLCPTILHGQTPSFRNSPQSTHSVSLKGKSDAELLQLITGSTKPVVQKPDRFYDDDQVTPSPLDRLWEMDPKDAALAFAVDAVSESMKGLTLKIDDPKASPPKSGEVGLRWISGNEYATPEEGITILKYDGYKSELLLSRVEIEKLEATDQDDDFDSSKLRDPDAMEKELARQEEERKKRRAELRLLRHAQFEGMDAADKLGLHDAVSALPELLRLANEDVDIAPDYNRPLIAAASIAARHSQCRAELTADLRRRLAETHEVTVRGSPVLEAIWRGDLRELTPELERMASSTRPPPDPNDVRVSGAEKASLILTAWRETDRLTKTKLDAILTGRIGGSGAIPEVLRTEFATLSAQDQLAFRQFINWMRTVDVPWSRRYLENVFTPHTPRPDIAFER